MPRRNFPQTSQKGQGPQSNSQKPVATGANANANTDTDTHAKEDKNHPSGFDAPRGWLGQRAALDEEGALEEGGPEEYTTLTGVEDEGEMLAS
jgi:hypothetical protein